MPVYPDSQKFYAVMSDLFNRVLADPSLLKPLRDNRVLLRMTLTGPDAVLTLDGRSNPVRFISGPTAGPADIALRLPADTLHGIWLGKVRLRDAFAAGTVKLESSPLRAFALMNSLTDLFRFIERIYPEVVRQHGLG